MAPKSLLKVGVVVLIFLKNILLDMELRKSCGVKKVGKEFLYRSFYVRKLTLSSLKLK